MKFVLLLCCFHFCIRSYSLGQTHRDMYQFERPVSIAEPGWLKKHNIEQVIIDSVIQTGPIPDLSGADIYKMSILIERSKAHPQKQHSLIVETRAAIRKKYWRIFSTTSQAYQKAVPAPEDFNKVAYYINGVVIKEFLEEELEKQHPSNITVDEEGVKITIKE